MKFTFSSLIIALGALCISCDKEVQAPEYVYIQASDQVAKSSLSGGTDVLWSGGDRLRVFSDASTSGEVFVLSDGARTSSGTFRGVALGGAAFYAAYPATTTFDGNTFTFSLPSDTDYVPGSFGEGTNPMLGSSSALSSFGMKNLCGVVKFQLKGSMKVSRFVFTFSSPVCGEGSVAKDGSTLVMDSGAGKSITMNVPDGLSLYPSVESDVYVVVPAAAYRSVEVKAFDQDGGSSVCTSSAFTVTRSKKTAIALTLPTPSGRPSIKTCSFNIYSQGMDSKSDASQKWSNRKAGVFAFLKSQNYDVFCTQECEYRQRQEILKNVPGYSAYGKGCRLGNEKDSGGEYDWDLWEYVYNNEDAANAVFYKTDLFNVLDKGTFWLTSSTPSTPSKYSKSKHYHACSWMKLQYKNDGITFYVFNTHLENGYTEDGEATRAYEMPILYSKVNAINSDALPMIVYGDFNGSTTDLWGYCPDCQNGWYWARNQDGKTGKDSYPVSLNNFQPWPEYKASNVDHIAYKNFYEASAGGKHGMVKGSFTTHNESWAGVTYISDHYPIEAEFLF